MNYTKKYCLFCVINAKADLFFYISPICPSLASFLMLPCQFISYFSSLKWTLLLKLKNCIFENPQFAIHDLYYWLTLILHDISSQIITNFEDFRYNCTCSTPTATNFSCRGIWNILRPTDAGNPGFMTREWNYSLIRHLTMHQITDYGHMMSRSKILNGPNPHHKPK